MLDPFISRSVQATNDNFKLLFVAGLGHSASLFVAFVGCGGLPEISAQEYKAADFSLAPLPTSEQLKLIEDFIAALPFAA